MAQNEIFRNGDFLSLPVPAGTKSGAALRIGGLNAVTQTDRANTAVDVDATTYNFGGGNPDGNATCWLTGVHELTLDFATTVGMPIYIDDTNKLLAAAGTGGGLFGHAVTAKAAAAGPVRVRLAN